VRSLFYNHIYAKWSEGAVQYDMNQADELDAGWHELVVEWYAIEQAKQPLGVTLKDQSVGTAHVQGVGDPTTMSMRLWEKYNEKARGDRFQFVVNQGGGMVLFNRMRRACQTCIHDKCGKDPGKFVVRGWKVFGEEKGMGRSDSCCVYTAVKYTDPQLTTLVKEYIWPAVKDLVDPDFIPLGFHKVCNLPLWAMPMPKASKEQAELGRTSKGSAGGLMGNILAKAYTEAATQGANNEESFTRLAKEEARAIVRRLYG